MGGAYARAREVRACGVLLALVGCGKVGGPTPTMPPEPPALEVEARSVVVGVVDGGPWMAGGPPDHEVWPVIDRLDAEYDVARVGLGQTISSGLDVLVAPLVGSVTQLELDHLGEAIDRGTPTVVIVDPLPVVDLGLMPRTPPADEGRVEAFLRRYGVQWEHDAVLVGSSSSGLASPEVMVIEGPTPVVVAYAGAIENVGAAMWEPIGWAPQVAGVAKASDYVEEHPFFGRVSVGAGRGDLQVRAGQAVVAARVAEHLVVVADLDAFAASTEGVFEQQVQAVREPANTDLLASLIHAAGPASGSTPALGAGESLWGDADPERIVAIDIIERGPWPEPDEGTDDATAEIMRRVRDEGVRPLQWLRLEARASRWWVRSDVEREADPAAVQALLDGLGRARWGEPREARLADPTTEPRSTAARIIVRDDRGRTTLDVVVEGSLARRAYSGATSGVTLDMKIAAAASAFAKPHRLELDAAEVEAIELTRYVVDEGEGTLVDQRIRAVPRDERVAVVQALNVLELVPSRTVSVRGLAQASWALRSAGLHLTPDGRLLGTVGHLDIDTKVAKLSIMMGALEGDHRMLGILSSEDPRTITLYRVREVQAQALLDVLETGS